MATRATPSTSSSTTANSPRRSTSSTACRISPPRAYTQREQRLLRLRDHVARQVVLVNRVVARRHCPVDQRHDQTQCRRRVGVAEDHHFGGAFHLISESNCRRSPGVIVTRPSLYGPTWPVYLGPFTWTTKPSGSLNLNDSSSPREPGVMCNPCAATLRRISAASQPSMPKS